MALVAVDLAGQSPRHGPDGTSVERLQQDGMGHQARDPFVAVEERMDLEQAVMRCGRCDDGGAFAKLAVDGLEALQEARDRARADRHEPTDLDVAATKSARNAADRFFRHRIFHRHKVVGQMGVEAAV